MKLTRSLFRFVDWKELWSKTMANVIDVYIKIIRVRTLHDAYMMKKAKS